jgi:hypothetical protein
VQRKLVDLQGEKGQGQGKERFALCGEGVAQPTIETPDEEGEGQTLKLLVE